VKIQARNRQISALAVRNVEYLFVQKSRSRIPVGR
jgi:hypothetical protein